MMNRRKFFTGSATAVAGATYLSSASAKTLNSGTDRSGVGGYNYRLPKFEKGSRLLFQDDSITEMKWGRNQQGCNHHLGHSYVYLIARNLL
jgi:hypothetical protein